MSPSKWTRNTNDKIIAGVCSGLGQYLGIDATIIRVAFVVLLFASGFGIPLYVLLTLILPRDDSDSNHLTKQAVDQNLDELTESITNWVDGNGSAETDQNGGRSETTAFFLIALGLFFLFSQLGWIHGAIFWPSLLVVIGLIILFRR